MTIAGAHHCLIEHRRPPGTSPGSGDDRRPQYVAHYDLSVRARGLRSALPGVTEELKGA